MKKYRIAEGLVVRCAKQRRLKELSFFYLLKYVYPAGCIHRYNPTSFRKKLLEKGKKYSRTKIDRHIKLFLKWGWCTLQNGHLFFKSNYDIQQRSKDIKIMCKDAELLSLLHCILIDRKKRQCMFSYKARRNDRRSKVRKSLEGSRSQKQRVMLNSVKSRSGALSNSFKAGCTKIGQVLGCARSTAHVRVRKAEKLNLLFIRNSDPKAIKKCTREESFKIRAKKKFQQTFFWKGGTLFQSQPLEYNIPFYALKRNRYKYKENFVYAANFSQSTSIKK